MINYLDLIHRMINECETNKTNLTELEATLEIANYLSITKIVYHVFANGISKRSGEVYSDNTSELGEEFVFTKNAPDNTRCLSIRIYRKSDAPSLSNDDASLLNIFAITVLNYTAIRFLQIETNHANLHDDLGATNITYFMSIVGKLIAMHQLTDYYFGYLNIKNCNKMNTVFGNATTTKIITEYSSLLSKKCDASLQENASRLGGDNFAFIVHKKNLDSFIDFIKNIHISLETDNDTIEYDVSCRAGIIPGSTDINSPSEALSRATAKYKLTRESNSEDIVVAHNNDLQNSSLSSEFSKELIDDLKNGKLLVYYQPVINYADNNRVVSAEALLRWRRSGELILPAEILPVAISMNFITEIDLFVLNKGCETIAKWISENKNVVPVSFNFSHHDFSKKDISEEIIQIVDKHNIDHSLVVIELKEAAYLEEYEALIYATKKLKNAGIAVAIDSYGVGYASLSLLKEIDFNYLKISSTLVNDENPKSIILLRNIIALAHDLSIQVVCQGVKDEESINRFIEIGNNYFQSDYFEKALSERFFQNKLC